MGRAGKDVGREMREEIEGKKRKKRSVYKGREEVKKKNKVIKR